MVQFHQTLFSKLKLGMSEHRVFDCHVEPQLTSKVILKRLLKGKNDILNALHKQQTAPLIAGSAVQFVRQKLQRYFES